MKIVLLLALLVGLAQRPALAQRAFSEEARQHAVGSSAGYQKRTKDERYEGLYSLPVAAPLLDVVSVTQGEIKYELSDTKKLIIKAPKLQAYKLIGISGISFGLSKNYRLDALVNSDGQKLIPIKDVLSPNDIFQQYLGVFGYLGEPQYPTLYIPVQVSDKLATFDAARNIRILLLPGATIDKLVWQYAASQQGQCAAFTKGEPPASGTGRFSAQQPIMLTLGTSAHISPGDEVCVNISYKTVGDTDWRTKNLKVLVPN